jgi:hypothetical protein
MNPDTITSISGASGILFAVLFVVLGLVNCFAGYRVFRFMVAVYGFIVGAVIGARIAGNLTDQVLLQAVGGLAGGVLGAALLAILYFVAVFIIGAVAGALLANLIGTAVGAVLPLWAVLLVAAIAGILALAFQRTVIILVTASGGSWAAVHSSATLAVGQTATVRSLIGRELIASQGTVIWLILLIAWFVLAIAGAVVQFRTAGSRPA